MSVDINSSLWSGLPPTGPCPRDNSVDGSPARHPHLSHSHHGLLRGRHAVDFDPVTHDLDPESGARVGGFHGDVGGHQQQLLEHHHLLGVQHIVPQGCVSGARQGPARVRHLHVQSPDPAAGLHQAAAAAKPARALRHSCHHRPAAEAGQRGGDYRADGLKPLITWFHGEQSTQKW